jgi:hypothetical protein
MNNSAVLSRPGVAKPDPYDTPAQKSFNLILLVVPFTVLMFLRSNSATDPELNPNSYRHLGQNSAIGDTRMAPPTSSDQPNSRHLLALDSN